MSACGDDVAPGVLKHGLNNCGVAARGFKLRHILGNCGTDANVDGKGGHIGRFDGDGACARPVRKRETTRGGEVGGVGGKFNRVAILKVMAVHKVSGVGVQDAL